MEILNNKIKPIINDKDLKRPIQKDLQNEKEIKYFKTKEEKKN